MRIKGPIHMIELDSKVIGIKINRKIEFFYFRNSQMNLFKRYLYVGNWIDLEYLAKKEKKGMYLAHTISSIYKIEAFGKLDHIVYFDKSNISSSLTKTLKSLKNVMFLDFEMTMPNYKSQAKGFKAEIIQAGLVIFDDKGNEIKRYSKYVRPTLFGKLSKRVLDFLSIDFDIFENTSITYYEFYNDFLKILEEYNPAIIVYGKNDSIVLNDSYTINGLPSLKNRTRFINILQLIKSFYDLKNDPGLFKLYNVYYELDNEQVHDALDDCYKTYLVFKKFLNDLETKEFQNKVRESFE